MIVPVVVAILLLSGGSVAAYQLWPDSGVLGAGPLEVPPTTDASGDGQPTAAGPSAATPSATPTTNAEAKAALTDCRAKVRAGDKIITAAETGIDHWDQHVQAQTDANARKITAAQLGKIFSRTRLLGPADLKRYNTAVEAYRDLDGSCAAVTDAADDVADGLSACRDRAADQKRVLSAGDDAMGDWAKHLRDMAKSRHEHVPDAQRVWIETWKAAPPHLTAWKSAMKAYRPPDC